jgi:hypothetical protein
VTPREPSDGYGGTRPRALIEAMAASQGRILDRETTSARSPAFQPAAGSAPGQPPHGPPTTTRTCTRTGTRRSCSPRCSCTGAGDADGTGVREKPVATITVMPRGPHGESTDTGQEPGTPFESMAIPRGGWWDRAKLPSPRYLVQGGRGAWTLGDVLELRHAKRTGKAG